MILLVLMTPYFICLLRYFLMFIFIILLYHKPALKLVMIRLNKSIDNIIDELTFELLK